MKSKKLLTPVLCLMVGISIGTHATNNTQPIVINAHDGKNNVSQFNSSQVEFYDNMVTNVESVEIYDSSKLTTDILTNRNGKIIIEKVIGEVTNNKLDGKILNCKVDSGDYISYQRVDGAKKGDKIVTYFIYNPFTNVEDDVMNRMDFIIDCNSI